MRTFEELQAGLGSVVGLHRGGGRSEHVVVLPSLSLGPSVEAYYGARLPSLEHRFLLTVTMLRRLPGCEVVLVMSVAPDPAVWDYYLDLAGAGDRADVARRAHLVTADDPSQRPLAATLLDRGDLLDRIRDLVAGRPGFIEPYNVTAAEVQVAGLGDGPVLPWSRPDPGADVVHLPRPVGVPGRGGARGPRRGRGGRMRRVIDCRQIGIPIALLRRRGLGWHGPARSDRRGASGRLVMST